MLILIRTERVVKGSAVRGPVLHDNPNFLLADDSLSAVNLNLSVRLAVGDVKSCTQRNGTRIEACQEESP